MSNLYIACRIPPDGTANYRNDYLCGGSPDAVICEFQSDRKLPLYRDLLLIAVGLVLYGLIVALHPYLIGVPAIL